MKMLIAIFCFSVAALSFAQRTPPPPPSGSSGGTIGTDDPNPIPTPRPGNERPHWDPNGPTPSPTPRPVPTPGPRPHPGPSPIPRPVPRPQSGYVIHVGDHVLYHNVEFIVMGTDARTRMLYLESPWDRSQSEAPANAVAKMNGCVNSNNGPVCSGDMTIGLNNLYYAVIAIFWNGTVVVETTDNSRTIYGNIDPNGLRVVR